MQRVIAGIVLGVGLIWAASPAVAAKHHPRHAAKMPAPVFTLTSSAFKDDGTLKLKNAGNNKRFASCIGYNVSPPLAWHNPPPGTKSFVLLMHDPEGRPPQGVEHMVIYGIPASVGHFAEGELSAPSANFVGGTSTMNLGSYAGPCTPPGTDWHHYTLTIIATDLDPKALPPGLTRADLIPALKGHVKGSAGLIMRWRYPR
jgi:Raf kinase inhibitor-like YbhB/YbcL family protein